MMGKLNDLLTSIISKVNASVKTEAQTLTDEQKAQARQNIGAAAEGGGGGVQPDWNQNDSTAADYIKNKPFGDFPTGGDTLTWDGNTEGLFDIGGMFYKISDSVVTPDDLANGLLVNFAGNRYPLTVENIQMSGGVVLDDGFVMIDFFILVPYDGYDLTPVGFEGFTCPKGVYSAFMDGMFISEFYIPGYTGFSFIKKIEEKFLPVKTFFVNILEETLGTAKYYLYTDDSFSVKATKLDTIEAIKNGNAVVRFIRNGELTGMASLLYASLTKDYAEACIVSGVINGSAIALYLYTAEYVPETT